MKFIKFTTLCLLYQVWGGENNVSRVKRGRWNKKVWETLPIMTSIQCCSLLVLFSITLLQSFTKCYHNISGFIFFGQEIIDNIATYNQNSHSLSLYNSDKYLPCKKHGLLFTLILALHYLMEHPLFSHGNNLSINFSGSFFHAKHAVQSEACDEHIIIIAFQRP